MAIITLYPALPPDGDGHQIPPDLSDLTAYPVGSFATETAQWWASSDPDDGSRVWLTRSGRWVYTSKARDYYLTVGEARTWLAEHGHRDAIREHIDVDRDGRGRPEIGPEVKVRLPEEVIERIDAAAERAGVSRAAHLRSIIMDTMPA